MLEEANSRIARVRRWLAANQQGLLALITVLISLAAFVQSRRSITIAEESLRLTEISTYPAIVVTIAYYKTSLHCSDGSSFNEAAGYLISNNGGQGTSLIDVRFMFAHANKQPNFGNYVGYFTRFPGAFEFSTIKFEVQSPLIFEDNLSAVTNCDLPTPSALPLDIPPGTTLLVSVLETFTVYRLDDNSLITPPPPPFASDFTYSQETAPDTVLLFSSGDEVHMPAGVG